MPRLLSPINSGIKNGLEGNAFSPLLVSMWKAFLSVWSLSVSLSSQV